MERRSRAMERRSSEDGDGAAVLRRRRWSGGSGRWNGGSEDQRWSAGPKKTMAVELWQQMRNESAVRSGRREQTWCGSEICQE